MSKYTVELGKLIETGFEIGLNDYPIFEETYRKGLNNKIIEHYYFREIGFETAELFKRFLNRTMNEIMPYYNQLYESERIKFDPMKNFDKWTTIAHDENNITDFTGKATDSGTEQGTNKQTYGEQSETKNKTTTGSVTLTDADGTNKTTGKVENDSSTSNNNLTIHSDTPQGMLSIGDIKNNTYATDATISEGSSSTGTTTTNNDLLVTSANNSTTKFNEKTNSDTTNKTNSETNSQFKTETNNVGESITNTKNKIDSDEVQHSSGKSEGESYSTYLLQYRETFLNIDMMIINDLANLFMNIY